MFEGGQHHLRGEGGRRGRLVGYSPNQMGDKRECGGGRKGGMEEEEGAPTLTLRGQRKKKTEKENCWKKMSHEGGGDKRKSGSENESVAPTSSSLNFPAPPV